MLSCETSLRLSLIQTHSNLDQIPDSASLMCSSADHPIKRKSKKSVQLSKQSQIMFTRKEQVPTKSVSQEKYVNQYVVPEVPEETSLQECQANVMDVKNCQVHMQPVKPTMDMWSVEPASYKLCNDKNPQATRCYKKKSPARPVYDD